MRHDEWIEQAACRGQWSMMMADYDGYDWAAAMRLCLDCSVRAECRAEVDALPDLVPSMVMAGVLWTTRKKPLGVAI